MAVIPIVADTQVGSTMALMPKKGWQRDDGNFAFPSLFQKKLHEQWEEYWDEVAEARKRDRLVVIHNGDVIDGYHHQTPQLITRRNDEQERMFTVLWDNALRKVKFDRRKDKQYFIRGTAAHADDGAQSEERIARDFDAIPQFEGTADNDYKDGRYTHYHFRNKIDGVLFDVAHHGPNKGRRAWTSVNALFHTIRSVYFDCLEHDLPIPRWWIRGHNHRHIQATYEGEHGKITGIVLPCWQGDTDFIHRISQGLEPKKKYGGLIFYVQNGQTWFTKHLLEWQEYPIGEV